jgi:hypothetical protein
MFFKIVRKYGDGTTGKTGLYQSRKTYDANWGRFKRDWVARFPRLKTYLVGYYHENDQWVEDRRYPEENK